MAIAEKWIMWETVTLSTDDKIRDIQRQAELIKYEGIHTNVNTEVFICRHKCRQYIIYTYRHTFIKTSIQIITYVKSYMHIIHIPKHISIHTNSDISNRDIHKHIGIVDINTYITYFKDIK